jgi:GT2 family glycosyltransferase
VSVPPEAALVSVVIVNYLSYSELRDCLSVLSPINGTLPVVVVDHASNPNAADDLIRSFPKLRVLRQPTNDGFAAGVNAGARITDSRFVLLLNPDCIIDRDACQSLADWLARNPEVGVAGPRIRNADGTVQPSARRFPTFSTAIAGRSSWFTRVMPNNPLSRRNLPGRDEALSSPLEVDWVSGACMLVRREAFDAVGGMDEGFFLYWEDADFCRRLKQAGWKTAYYPEVVVTHIGGRSSRHATDASLEAFHRSAFRLFWKHSGSFTRVLAPVVFLALRMRLLVMRRLVRRRGRRGAH